MRGEGKGRGAGWGAVVRESKIADHTPVMRLREQPISRLHCCRSAPCCGIRLLQLINCPPSTHVRSELSGQRGHHAQARHEGVPAAQEHGAAAQQVQRLAEVHLVELLFLAEGGGFSTLLGGRGRGGLPRLPQLRPQLQLLLLGGLLELEVVPGHELEDALAALPLRPELEQRALVGQEPAALLLAGAVREAQDVVRDAVLTRKAGILQGAEEDESVCTAFEQRRH